VRCDIAFGGAFYAYVDAQDVGVRCIPGDFRPLIERAWRSSAPSWPSGRFPTRSRRS